MGVIIVPYRNRQEHLQKFVPHLQKFVPDLQIKVIEQADEKGFNRGKLLNIGYLEFDADYYVFHDVDMLPEKADYSFPKVPVHLATQVEQFNYTMPYPEYFGGVTLFNKFDFKRVNGFTNEIYSWGNEDDILRRDLHWKGIKIQRRVGVFKSLAHERPQGNDSPEYKLNELKFRNGRKSYDGLSWCKYEVVHRQTFDSYELIKVIL